MGGRPTRVSWKRHQYKSFPINVTKFKTVEPLCMAASNCHSLTKDIVPGFTLTKILILKINKFYELIA